MGRFLSSLQLNRESVTERGGKNEAKPGMLRDTLFVPKHAARQTRRSGGHRYAARNDDMHRLPVSTDASSRSLRSINQRAKDADLRNPRCFRTPRPETCNPIRMVCNEADQLEALML